MRRNREEPTFIKKGSSKIDYFNCLRACFKAVRRPSSKVG